MSLLLFYDTETTGLYHHDLPPNDVRQPRLVQIAAALVDADTRETVQEINLLIAPDDWQIPTEATAIHGITTEHAKRCGINEHAALEAFYRLYARADVRVAHNEAFDSAIVYSALMSAEFPEDVLAHWKEGQAFCTQQLGKHIAPASPHGPTLSAAYQHYFGKPLQGAHDARIDMHACKDVYFNILDNRPPVADKFKDDRSSLTAIWREALGFFEWNTGDTRYVTTTSCVLFAEHWAKKACGKDADNYARIHRLEAAIERTIEENLHLADGDNCTLIHLKRAMAHE